MQNNELKIIYFPHIIFGNELGGKVHTFNDIKGGMKNLSDFNINQYKFLGGNSSKEIGLISEYGFYACPHIFDMQKIVAFYVHDPEMVTDLGKKLIQDKYPDYEIVFEKMTPTVHKVLTKEEIEKKKGLLAQIQEAGINPKLVDKSTVEELDGLLKAVESGKSELKVEREGAVMKEPEAKPKTQKLNPVANKKK